jgi:hypothetical protein
MTVSRLLVPLLTLALLPALPTFADEAPLRSGPQAGETLPGPFNPLNVTNAESPDYAGTRSDYTEQHGANPVVLVFARELGPPVLTLARRLDSEVSRNKAARLRVVVIVLSDDAAVERRLKTLARKQALQHVSLALLAPPGPKPYKLSNDADCTVLLYRHRKIETNHAFRMGGLTEKETTAVVSDLRKLVLPRE